MMEPGRQESNATNCFGLVTSLSPTFYIGICVRFHWEKGVPHSELNLDTTSLSPLVSPLKQIHSEADFHPTRSKPPDIIYQKDSGEVGDDASVCLQFSFHFLPPQLLCSSTGFTLQPKDLRYNLPKCGVHMPVNIRNSPSGVAQWLSFNL